MRNAPIGHTQKSSVIDCCALQLTSSSHLGTPKQLGVLNLVAACCALQLTSSSHLGTQTQLGVLNLVAAGLAEKVNSIFRTTCLNME